MRFFAFSLRPADSRETEWNQAQSYCSNELNQVHLRSLRINGQRLVVFLYQFINKYILNVCPLLFIPGFSSTMCVANNTGVSVCFDVLWNMYFCAQWPSVTAVAAVVCSLNVNVFKWFGFLFCFVFCFLMLVWFPVPVFFYRITLRCRFVVKMLSL